MKHSWQPDLDRDGESVCTRCGVALSDDNENDNCEMDGM